MAFEAPAARPLRSAYEREVQQQGAAQLLASPSLLAAWAGQQGVSVARAELQLLQARRLLTWCHPAVSIAGLATSPMLQQQGSL